MTTDETLRRAERQGDRAELVRAMVLRITGAHRFTFEDPDAHLGLTTTWLEGNDPNPGWRGDGPQVLARTLDLVEPGDGEQVLAPLTTACYTQSAARQKVGSNGEEVSD